MNTPLPLSLSLLFLFLNTDDRVIDEFSKYASKVEIRGAP